MDDLISRLVDSSESVMGSLVAHKSKVDKELAERRKNPLTLFSFAFINEDGLPTYTRIRATNEEAARKLMEKDHRARKVLSVEGIVPDLTKDDEEKVIQQLTEQEPEEENPEWRIRVLVPVDKCTESFLAALRKVVGKKEEFVDKTHPETRYGKANVDFFLDTRDRVRAEEVGKKIKSKFDFVSAHISPVEYGVESDEPFGREDSSERVVTEQEPEEEGEPTVEPEKGGEGEPPSPPEKAEEPEESEKEEIGKEYFGKKGDDFLYLVSSEEGEKDLQIVDQEGTQLFSASENDLDTSDVFHFLIAAGQDIEPEDVSIGIINKYWIPAIEEYEEKLRGEEEGKEGGEGIEEPEGLTKETPEQEETVESICEVKVVIDRREFDVDLVEDTEEGIVIRVSAPPFEEAGERATKEVRFSPTFANIYRNKESGKITEEGLKELGLDALANMEDEEFDKLAAGAPESEKEIEEKKATPTCKKCGGKHWPFQPCVGKVKPKVKPKVKVKKELPKKEKPKAKPKPKAKESRADESADVSKDVKELINATSDALKAGDYVKAAELSQRLSTIQQSIPPSIDADNEAEVEDKGDEEKVEKETEDGKDQPGVRDGTGPARGSYQRSQTGSVGKRKLAGEECPNEGIVPDLSKDSEETIIKKLTEEEEEESLHDRFSEWCQLQGITPDDDSYDVFMGEEERRKAMEREEENEGEGLSKKQKYHAEGT